MHEVVLNTFVSFCSCLALKINLGEGIGEITADDPLF
jgi:hypothetical protein